MYSKIFKHESSEFLRTVTLKVNLFCLHHQLNNGNILFVADKGSISLNFFIRVSVGGSGSLWSSLMSIMSATALRTIPLLRHCYDRYANKSTVM